MCCTFVRWNFDCELGFYLFLKIKKKQPRSVIASCNLSLLWEDRDLWEDFQCNRQSSVRVHRLSQKTPLSGNKVAISTCLENLWNHTFRNIYRERLILIYTVSLITHQLLWCSNLCVFLCYCYFILYAYVSLEFYIWDSAYFFKVTTYCTFSMYWILC